MSPPLNSLLMEHASSPLDYGLYGLLAVIVIRELFGLVRWALSNRKTNPRANPNGAMSAGELRQHFETISDALRSIRDTQIEIKGKIGEVRNGVTSLLQRGSD